MRFPVLAALVMMCFAADAAVTTVVAYIDDPELTALVSGDDFE